MTPYKYLNYVSNVILYMVESLKKNEFSHYGIPKIVEFFPPFLGYTFHFLPSLVQWSANNIYTNTNGL